MSTTSAPVRRTQAERRARTRRKLVEATVRSLIEVGYAGTTTARVCAEAGVSSGALFNHFASKAELLVAAAGEVLPRALERAAVRAGDVTQSADQVGDVVRLAADAYTDPELVAVLELWVVARNDEELDRLLEELNTPHRSALYEVIRALLPEELREHPDLITVSDLVLNAVFGMALGREPAPEQSTHAQQVELLADLVRDRLTA